MTDEHDRYREHYTQPIQTLDLAWDALMAEDVRSKDGPFNTVTALMLKGVEPPDISHILDVAISAFLEGGRRRPLLLTQVEGDLLFRLVQAALQAPHVSLTATQRADGAMLQVRIANEILES